MAPENTSATPTTKTKEQPKQRVSVSDERKAHPSSANARRMSSATKTDASNQHQSLQAYHPTQNAAAQRKNDKAATKNCSKSRESKHAPKAPIIATKTSFLPSHEYRSAEDVQAAVDEMREFFQTGATMPLHYRRGVLVKLRAYLKKHEKEALQALTDDLGKSSFEGYATELGIVYDEIRFCLSKMYGWAKPKRVPTPLAHFPSSSKIYASPYGVAAVLSPWNYPLQLALVPMIECPHSRQLCSAQAFTHFAVDKRLPPKTLRRGFRRAFGALPSRKQRNERLDLKYPFRQNLLHWKPNHWQTDYACCRRKSDRRHTRAGREKSLHYSLGRQHQTSRTTSCLGEMHQLWTDLRGARLLPRA